MKLFGGAAKKAVVKEKKPLVTVERVRAATTHMACLLAQPVPRFASAAGALRRLAMYYMCFCGRCIPLRTACGAPHK